VRSGSAHQHVVAVHGRQVACALGVTPQRGAAVKVRDLMRARGTRPNTRAQRSVKMGHEGKRETALCKKDRKLTTVHSSKPTQVGKRALNATRERR
jgi:hypothetical protein